MVSAVSGTTPAMTAAEYVPERLDLPTLREAVQACRGCPLYADATQAVFGEGAAQAEVMLVGEQPGDKEDLAGRPFVGPAGRLLDEALAEAGIDRSRAYVTNAVKHFKWQGRGKRRIHQKPTWSESVACRPWLEAELAAVGPRVVVALGATAAQSLLGKDFRVTKQRG
jgi:uracil-DNA glycosylase